MQHSRHAFWVRLTHATAAASLALLIFSGVEILMVHPRLYWGEAGNDLTTPLLELPISRNHRHGGWTPPTPFFAAADAPVTAGRTFEIFNQNGWGRSLHFLAAWLLVAAGVSYVAIGLLRRHFARHFVPAPEHRTAAALARDALAHARGPLDIRTGPAAYGPLQRLTYLLVVFAFAPLAVLTGVTMSPAIVAAAPWLLDVFGGHQSARTLHFGAFVLFVGFTVMHLVMVGRTGARRQIRSMTLGDRA